MENEYMILEFSTDYERVINNIKKYESFLNNRFQKHSKEQMAIETIANGCLYLFKNHDDFFNYFDKILENMNSIKEKPYFEKKNILVNFLLHRVINKKDYPEVGIYFKITPVANSLVIEKIFQKYNFELSKTYLKKIHQDVKLVIENNSYIIQFPTYSSIIAFGNFMFYFVYKLDK